MDPHPQDPLPDAGSVTALLERVNDGDRSAHSELLSLVYDELRGLAGKMFASAGSDHVLQSTALAHEAYIKLLGSSGNRSKWEGRRHFFAVAATAMRRVLADYARRNQSQKRRGSERAITLHDGMVADHATTEIELLDLHEVLEEIEKASPRIARVFELRYFSGMTVPEVAMELSLTERTVFNDWRACRAILRQRLFGRE